MRLSALTIAPAGLLAAACVVTEVQRPGGPFEVPTVPEVSGTSPASPSNDPRPRVRGRAEPGSIVRIYVDASCATAPIGEATAEELETTGITVSVPRNATSTLYANATDAFGHTSPCSATGVTYVHDDVAPTFGGLSAATPVNGSQVTLSWSPGSDAGTAAESAVYEICVAKGEGGCSPFAAAITTSAGATMWNVGGLDADTPYTFAVRTRDAAGNADANSVSVSVRTPGRLGAQALAVGGYHSCAIAGDGSVQCWGWNVQGQLGATDYGETAGGGGLDPAFLLESVRSPLPVRVGGLSGARAVSAGVYHSCAIAEGGKVHCWGSNGAGQLGDGSSTDFRAAPAPVKDLGPATALVSGGGHTCAVVAQGGVRCWGWNVSGQLGDGTTAQRNAPVPVKDLQGVVALAAGTWHTCALHADGQVSCFGENGAGQLGAAGAGSPVPVRVAGVSRAVAVAAGSEHSCALLLDGTATCWGSNAVGPVGDGSAEATRGPAAVAGLAGAVGIAAGESHTCAMLGDGTARCWGRGDFGQLGDGGKEPRPAPAPVQGLAAGAALAAGGARSGDDRSGHTCALLRDGTARCWGRNDLGQLGDGTFEDRALPVEVASFK